MNNGNRTVQLSVLQRIGLENLLGEQRGKREDIRTLHNIRKKIRMPAEERRQYVVQLPTGQTIFDDTAAERAEPVEVTLTGDEVRRLIKLGDSTEMPAAMLDWLEPLLQRLEEKTPGSDA